MAEENIEQSATNRMDSALAILDGVDVAEGQEQSSLPDEQVPVKEEVSTKEVPTKEVPAKEKIGKSEYYARLMAKEKEIRDMKARMKEYESNPSNDIKNLAKNDPLKAIEELGLSMDQILDVWATPDEQKQEEQEPVDTTNEEIMKIKKELEEIKKAKEESEMQYKYKQALKDADSVISKDTERWELINQGKPAGSLHTMIKAASDIFQATGERLSYEEVADEVENFLKEENIKYVNSLKSVNKLKYLFEQQAKQEEQQQKQIVDNEEQNVSLSLSTPNHGAPRSQETLSREEKLQRALIILEQQQEDE